MSVDVSGDDQSEGSNGFIESFFLPGCASTDNQIFTSAYSNTMKTGVLFYSIALDHAGENLRITSHNVKAWINGVSDLLEAQAVLQSAEDRLAKARNNYFYPPAAYKKATGRDE